MGCCFSKKRKKHPDGSAAALPGRYRPEDRDPPSPEEEKVKEVLSETPSAKVTVVDPKPVANAVAVEEQEVTLKVKAVADAAASDLGSCFSLATDERSEAASESSVATSSVMGPERSPGKPAARRRPVSGELGGIARRDRDRAVAASYGVRSRSCRASPSPPPRREPPRDRSVRRSPSPAAKRATTTEQHRAASPAAPLQRKPPVPSRRASPHRARDAAPPPPPPPPLSPPPQPEEDAVAAGGEDRVAGDNASGNGQGHGDSDGEGKESLENPLVSMECFIFL
ncbi:serine/arginine repetitive matrix protein 1-like [Lolium rigidum]|uniref:serine/arginine repetitive matrix protein 1-like n=1 Tax=Lolium rigidum TaxID=89674 RepID=UPI001F5C3436|nr:serine/arginine repetitive matrix protein 1-like [Lolium rigidum]